MSRTRLQAGKVAGVVEIPLQKKDAPLGADEAIAAAIISGEPPAVHRMMVSGRQPKNPRLVHAVTAAGETVLVRVHARVRPLLVEGMEFQAVAEAANLYVMVPPLPRAKGRF